LKGQAPESLGSPISGFAQGKISPKREPFHDAGEGGGIKDDLGQHRPVDNEKEELEFFDEAERVIHLGRCPAVEAQANVESFSEWTPKIGGSKGD